MDSHKNSFILPKDANGHDYVEIAGIKWATMNVGANKVTDYGLYFQWGDISGYTADQVSGDTTQKKAFARDYSDYDADRNFKKYNLSSEGKKELTLDDDAVHAAWGGSWRMPTTGDMQTVYEAIQTSAVTANWTSEYNGTSVAGYEIHDKNSNDTLFFPACGYAYDGVVYDAGVLGVYWLSSLSTDGVRFAYELYFSSIDADVGIYYRFGGQCVRGVLAEK